MVRRAIRSTLFASALTCSALVPCLAQAHHETITVDVPFAFTLGSAQLAPGTYHLTLPHDFIMNAAGPDKSVQAMVFWNQGPRSKARTKAVFHRYGNQYFLREVWLADRGTYLSMQETRQEKQARQTIAMAQPQAKPEELALAVTPEQR